MALVGLYPLYRHSGTRTYQEVGTRPHRICLSPCSSVSRPPLSAKAHDAVPLCAAPLPNCILRDSRFSLNDCQQLPKFVIAPRDVRRIGDAESPLLEVGPDRDGAGLSKAVLVHLERDQATFFVERVQKRQIAGAANHTNSGAKMGLRPTSRVMVGFGQHRRRAGMSSRQP